MDVVSSAAQFFSAPASGSSAGTAAGAASLFGNGGGAMLGAGLVAPTGEATDAIATFETLLAALISGDGASVQSALKAAVADGAVTVDHGQLALGPALQQIIPAELTGGKPALDRLIADGKAAPAAALLAMLLNGDGDVPSIRVEVATESAPAGFAAGDIVPELADADHLEPILASEPKPAKGAKTISLVAAETASLPSVVLAESAEASGAVAPTPIPTAAAMSDAVPAIADAPNDDAGAALDDGGSDKDAKAAREQAALDLMAALLAQQPVAPTPVAPKADVALTIEAAAAPTDPAPLTDLPAAPVATSPAAPAAGAPTSKPEEAPPEASETMSDFAGELAPPPADAPAPKPLAAKAETSAHTAASEKLAAAASRPVNDGAPSAPQPATGSNTSNMTAATASTAGGDTGANLHGDGQPPSDNGQRQPAEIDQLRSGAAIADSGRAAGHQDFASQLASASRGSHGSGSHAQMPAFQQVAVQIRRAVIEGDDHLSIQLKPAELGRIDVRLHFTGDGRVSAHVTADNVATLDLMQRDTRGLERALQDAGLQTDSGSLSFNLRGDNRQAHDQDNRNASGNARFSLDGPVEVEPEELPAGRWVPAGRVDVRV